MSDREAGVDRWMDFLQLQYLGLSVLLRVNHVLGFIRKAPCAWDIVSLHVFLTWLFIQILWIPLGCHLLLEAFFKGPSIPYLNSD